MLCVIKLLQMICNILANTLTDPVLWTEHICSLPQNCTRTRTGYYWQQEISSDWNQGQWT